MHQTHIVQRIVVYLGLWGHFMRRTHIVHRMRSYVG
jgi:hypothetical protein